MNVKQRLRLNSICSTAALLIVLAVLALSAYRVNRALGEANIASEIMTASYQRLMLRTDNHRTLSERSREQLVAKHREIGELLETAKGRFSTPENRKTIDGLIANHAAIGRLSRAIRANREKREAGAPPDPLDREYEDRLTSQLNMKVYEAILLDTGLQQSGNRALVSSLRFAVGGIVLVLLLASFGTLANSRTMGRSITDRIRLLRDGVVIIGEGNLDHRIDLAGRDELTDLSAAFNAMTGKLHDTYAKLRCEIDERWKAEEALRQREALLHAVTENNPGPIFMKDRESRLLFANPATLRLIGKRAEEIIGKKDDEYYANPADGRAIMDNDRKVMEAGQIEVVEETLTNPDGSRRFFISSKAPCYDDHGRLIGLVGVGHDITERKLAEEALKASLREKEVLLKEIHHRVKNNLQVISSLVSLQADGARDETVRGVLEEVTGRVRSMALVHEKLYQSHILASIDFADYAGSLLHQIWRSHGTVSSSVRLSLDLRPVQLPVDTAVPCGLILNELAGNALKHAFGGLAGGEVRVSLENGEGGMIRLCVADNGKGLPEGFDWRQTQSLGFRLVQMLSAQIGADVEVGSGEGTRFEIAFRAEG